MKNKNRPISPHLQIYKPQLTSILSISHRFTGIILYLSTFLISFWLFCIAFNNNLKIFVYVFIFFCKTMSPASNCSVIFIIVIPVTLSPDKIAC